MPCRLSGTGSSRRRSVDAVDSPRLAAHLGRVPAGQYRDEGQREAVERQPEQHSGLLDTPLVDQIRSDPGDQQHDQPAADHYSKREEGNDHWRPVLRREIGQPDLLGGEAHAPYQAAENRDRDLIVIGFRRRVGEGDQDLACRLLTMPTALDGGEFNGLIVMDIIAVEVSEEALDQQQHRREIQAHAEHNARFGVEFPTQQVPGTGSGDAKGAGKVGSEQHMREAHPQHRTEQDLEPVVRLEGTVSHHIADRHLHPAVIGHDPERRERGSQRHHSSRKQIEPWRHTRATKQQDPEKARLEEKSGPWIGPDMRASTLQFVPNWNAMTIPETTPSPNATPKILSQNSKTRRYAGRPVRRCSASRTVSHAASPIVNDGKMMWKETVNANWSRDSRSAVRSIGLYSPVSCDPLGMGEHLKPIVPCDADEGEAYRLCNADGQSRRRRHPDDNSRPHHG